jgi:hypothetical protein
VQNIVKIIVASLTALFNCSDSWIFQSDAVFF